MSSLYTATEFGTDLQTLGFLGHHPVDRARVRTFIKQLGIESPRVARWLVKVAMQHGIGKAELSGWILAGEQKAEPAGLPTLLAGAAKSGPDGLPSAYFGGLLRLGQTPNGELWGADVHRKAMPVYQLDPKPDGNKASWRRKFERLDDFVFYATKAALCTRDRITVEEYFDLARERGVRPEELVPDALEDEREQVNRLGLRRAKKVPPLANRFIWVDVAIARAYMTSATVAEIARLYVDVHRLHTIREEAEKMSDPSLASFWLFRHALFGDEAGYKRVLAKVGKKKPTMVEVADEMARNWVKKGKKPLDRATLCRAVEQRSSLRR